MTKGERALRDKIDLEGEKLERWFRRMNRAVTAMNAARRKLKALHRQLAALKQPRPKKPKPEQDELADLAAEMEVTGDD